MKILVYFFMKIRFINYFLIRKEVFILIGRIK